ncbi:MAG: TlpA disulfide reductase family protein [Niabella sp.]
MNRFFLFGVTLILSSCLHENKFRSDFKPANIFVASSVAVRDSAPLRYTNIRGLSTRAFEDPNRQFHYILYLNKPTILSYPPISAIIRPGQDYTINSDSLNNLYISSPTDIDFQSKRNQLKEIFKYASASFPQVFSINAGEVNIDRLLQAEMGIVHQLDLRRRLIPKLIDSISQQLHIPNYRRQEITKLYLARYYEPLYQFYFSNATRLRELNIFKEKINRLIPYLNEQVDKDIFFASGAEAFVRGVIDVLQPTAKENLKSEAEVLSNFNFIKSNFTGLAKDYGLAYTMCVAISKNISLSNKVYRHFYKNCRQREYRGYVWLEKNKKDSMDDVRSHTMVNSLISFTTGHSITIDQLLSKNKGKIILLHFWASWCVPCLQQMPKLADLENDFKTAPFISISISTDKDIYQWKAISTKMNISEKNAYVINIASNQDFVARYVKELPKYILIDKTGNIIDNNIPIEKLADKIKNQLGQQLNSFLKFPGAIYKH